MGLFKQVDRDKLRLTYYQRKLEKEFLVTGDLKDLKNFHERDEFMASNLYRKIKQMEDDAKGIEIELDNYVATANNITEPNPKFAMLHNAPFTLGTSQVGKSKLIARLDAIRGKQELLVKGLVADDWQALKNTHERTYAHLKDTPDYPEFEHPAPDALTATYETVGGVRTLTGGELKTWTDEFLCNE